MTKVFMSHLHKDHASAISYIHPEYNDRFISFPYAHYYIQRREFDFAMEGNKSSYLPESIELLEDYSKTIWLDDDEGLIDGYIKYQLTGAHSKFHQVCWIHEEEDVIFFGELTKFTHKFFGRRNHAAFALNALGMIFRSSSPASQGRHD